MKYFEIESTWSTAKCRLRKSFDAWYYIVIFATFCVSFLSKSKATNIFPRHTLKSKVRDKSVQARKILFCHVIVKSNLCNILWKFLIKIESKWRREIKEQAPQLTLMHSSGRTVRSSHRRCSIKRVVLKNFAICRGNTCVRVSFSKSCRSEGPQLYQKEAPTEVFSCEYCEILRLPISKNICERLLFDCFNGSMLHGPKGSRSKLYDDVRVQGPSHRSSFCF